MLTAGGGRWFKNRSWPVDDFERWAGRASNIIRRAEVDVRDGRLAEYASAGVRMTGCLRTPAGRGLYMRAIIFNRAR